MGSFRWSSCKAGDKKAGDTIYRPDEKTDRARPQKLDRKKEKK